MLTYALVRKLHAQVLFEQGLDFLQSLNLELAVEREGCTCVHMDSTHA